MRFLTGLILAMAASSAAFSQEQPPSDVPYQMELPSGLRNWFRNPDG